MTQIYLHSLDVTEFRNFAHLTVKLPPKPGVMLVHGTNGLGKSSLFDGIEWALTGKIEHFAQSARGAKEMHYLRRWHAHDNRPTAITLAFSDDRFIRRTLGRDEADGESDVAAYLRSADWQQNISNLQRYLLLTHFLGQSTMSRMTHRKPEDRWEFLQEPAQSDWATKIAQTLHGHGSSTAAKAYERRQADYVAEATSLEQLLSQEALAFGESRISGAIDDNAAREASLALLHDLEPSLAWLGISANPSIDLSVEQAQDTLQRLTHSVPSAILARRAVLEQAGKLTQMLAPLHREQASAAAAWAAARDELTTSQSTLRTLKEQADAADATASAARATEQTCGDRVARLNSLLERHEQTLRMHEEIDLLDTRLTNAETERDAAARAVAKEEHRKDLALRLDRELVEIAREVGHTSEVIEALQEATRLTQELRERHAEIEGIDAEHTEVARLIEDNRREIHQAKSAINNRANELAAARQSVDDLSAAVAQVAALLSPDACVCPVCDTQIKKAGELQAKALAAASRLAPSIAAYEQSLQSAKESERTLITDGENLRLRQQINNEARETIAQLRSALRQALKRGLGPETDSAEEKELIAHRVANESWRTAALQRQARKQRWRQHAILAAADGQAWAQTLSHRNALELDQRAAMRRRDQLRTDATSATAAIRLEMTSLLNTPLPDPATLREAIRDADLRLEQARSTRHAALEARQHAADAVSRAGVLLAEQSARTTERQRHHDDLVQTEASHIEAWDRLALQDVALGDGDAIRRMEEELAALDAHYAQIRLRVDQLREGRIAWARNQSHRAALAQLRQRAKHPAGTRDDVRTAALRLQSELTRKAEAVARAKNIARASFANVSSQVQEFNEEYLRPLSQVMGKFNKAILSDPSIGFDLKVVKNKVNQISRRAATSTGLKEVALDPHLVHSEGQMAALAVSMLCAASLTFPWSRWRGLVLDDPLQHNDVIRSAAFADMVCNLVNSQQYQILLSTHDLAQAQFLRRKFDAQGIPMTMVHLRGRDVSDNGTQVDISYHNMDAGESDPVAASA
ncbi:AAA family ATPase [Cupriavidus metallidurans]|uniref:AAA family ATPase n=1 Tax=Cupriavidus metallidurans TaxID=119219 RepID=UPI001CC911FF|nr:AAA family ATPase [Cupriavidus metallidurans]UBM09386.1 AAA family ATPase [Cupriavidus metallidurans]